MLPEEKPFVFIETEDRTKTLQSLTNLAHSQGRKLLVCSKGGEDKKHNLARYLKTIYTHNSERTVYVIDQEDVQFDQQLLATFQNIVPRLKPKATICIIGEDSQERFFRRASIQAGSYEDWIERIERNRLPKDLKTFHEKLKNKPLISIIIPIYNTKEEYLIQCLNSVREQYYPNWELCLADDASTNPNIKKILELYRAKDPGRIKVAYRETNGHISEASNSALSLATGEYVALVDHDDLLPRYALSFIAYQLNQTPEAQIIYSDEDKVDENNRRFYPHFKSDWNRDLFYSNNYASHLTVYKKELLDKTSGFRQGFEGSQDYDMLLRAVSLVKDEEIKHIPVILYHWRACEGSTAKSAGNKDYATEAGIKALQEHFIGLGEDVEVSQAKVPTTYRVKWGLKKDPLVSLIIPTKDKRELIEPCVKSILEKTTYTNYEVLIIDNNSSDEKTLAFFKTIVSEDARVKVLRFPKPFNYSAINNFAARHAKGKVLGLLNNDTKVISPDWLREMVSHAMRPDIGCVGAKLYREDGTLQHGGVILGIAGLGNHAHDRSPGGSYGYMGRLILTHNLSAVTAACLLIRKTTFLKVGGLNERHLTVAFNDVDLCMKVNRAGYRNLWTPYAELYHLESVSRGVDDTPEKYKRHCREVSYMQRVWDFPRYPKEPGDPTHRGDPMYNPNLTLDNMDFSYSWEIIDYLGLLNKEAEWSALKPKALV